MVGACRFPGSHLVEHLARSGYRVIAFDEACALSGSSLHVRALKRAGATVREVDPTRIASFQAALAELLPRKAPEAAKACVFHLGFCSEEEDDPDRLLELEVEGTRNLMQAIQRIGAGLSVMILRTGAGTKQREGGLLRGSPYLSAKDEQERTALSYDPTPEVAVLRATNVLGPRAQSWLGQLLLRLGKLPLLPGILPPASLPVVHVDDVCRAALFLASRQGSGNAYVCPGPGAVTLERTIALLAEMTGKPRLPAFSAGQRWMALERVQQAIRRVPLPDVQRLFEQAKDPAGESKDVASLGFTLIHDQPIEIVRQTIQWYQRSGWLRGQ